MPSRQPKDTNCYEPTGCGDFVLRRVVVVRRVPLLAARVVRLAVVPVPDLALARADVRLAVRPLPLALAELAARRTMAHDLGLTLLRTAHQCATVLAHRLGPPVSRASAGRHTLGRESPAGDPKSRSHRSGSWRSHRRACRTYAPCAPPTRRHHFGQVAPVFDMNGFLKSHSG